MLCVLVCELFTPRVSLLFLFKGRYKNDWQDWTWMDKNWQGNTKPGWMGLYHQRGVFQGRQDTICYYYHMLVHISGRGGCLVRQRHQEERHQELNRESKQLIEMQMMEADGGKWMEQEATVYMMTWAQEKKEQRFPKNN